jgi:CRISPR-associated endonuclease Cas1
MTSNSAALSEETFGAATPRDGVYVADGYGLRIAVERGHLIIEDGYGRHRRYARFPKVGHDLRRLVILGHSGILSLEALRWLDKLRINVTQIDSDSRVLYATASSALDDARLRRSQALIAGTSEGVKLAAVLIDAKLAGQRDLVRHVLGDAAAAVTIEDLRKQLATVEDVDAIRGIEAKAATQYFGTWTRRVSMRWATKDQGRIPDHWTGFDFRRSPLATGSNIRAADPINAQLNYLYALAEAECRRACLVLGLDPGLGVLHADVKSRDSLALDLIETIRPAVDHWLLALLRDRVYRRNDFSELDDGHCRVHAPLTHELATSLTHWERLVAPRAEYVAHAVANASPYAIRRSSPLTSAARRAAQLGSTSPNRAAPSSRGTQISFALRAKTCLDCGGLLPRSATNYCAACWPLHRSAGQVKATALARELNQDPDRKDEWRKSIAAAKREREDARLASLGWSREDWGRFLPAVRELSLVSIQEATGLSKTQASRIKSGKQIPTAGHWAALVSISQRPGHT